MSTVPASSYGIQQQVVAAPPVGSNGSIYSNGKAISANNAQAQNRAKFGGKKGGAATIPVPVVPIPYREAGGGSNTAASNVTSLTTATAKGSEQRKYDAVGGCGGSSCGLTGGRRRSKRRSHKRRSHKRKRSHKRSYKRNGKSRGKRSK